MIPYTVNDLIEKIQHYIETEEYPLAFEFCQRALQMEPDNVNALELIAQVEMELALYDQAKEHLFKLIQLQPNTNFDTFMYLGQLLVEKEAIDAFQKGVDVLVTKRNAIIQSGTNGEMPNNELAQDFARKISTALCSMTEIYMTDCCFEPEAEHMCEEYLKQAQEVDPQNAVVYQMLASVRLSQDRKEEAESALRHSLSLWLGGEIDEKSIPSYGERISLVKLLLELGMFDEAFQVLEGLEKEDDQVVDLWYLFGWSYYCLGDDETQDAEEQKTHWGHARACLEMAVKLYQDVQCDDEALLEHTRELLAIIGQVVPFASLDENEDGMEIHGDVDEDFDSDNEDDAMEI